MRTACDRVAGCWTAVVERGLTGADVLSLVALLFAVTAAISIAMGEPNYGIVLMFGAYGFDKLDGLYARRFDCTRQSGRRLDSFVDVFIYLLTGALLFHFEMAPSRFVGVAVGILLITFGVLRLKRFTAEGFRTEGERRFYRGMTVVHANLVAVGNYFVLQFVPVWNGWAAGATIAVIAPLMLSNYRSYKTRYRQALVGVLGVGAVGLALALEIG